MEKEDVLKHKEDEKLATMPVGKLFWSLALPAVTSQIVNLLYAVIDRMYVGHIPGSGSLALTALGVCLPVLTIISAFASLVSMGAAPQASIALGKKDHARANQIMGNSFTALMIVSAILMITTLVFTAPILNAFGASPETLPYAVPYMRIYAGGTFFVLLTLGLNAFITAEGFAKKSMLTVLIGAICNIILDPIFIFVFNMGVSGAAIATIISQGISCVWVLSFLLSKKSTLNLKKEYFPLKKDIILPAMALGMAPFIMMSTESLLMLCFNSSLLKYGGNLAVGMMTILTSIMQFAFLPLQGLMQGAQPIISYNYGAGNIKRMKDCFKIALISCFSYTMILFAVGELFPQVMAGMFTADPELLAMTDWGLRVYLAGVGLMGVQIACQQTFVALGKAKISTFLALLRKILLLIPLIYILPNFMENKVFAVILAEPIADIIAILTTATLFYLQLKKMSHENTIEVQ